MHVSTLITNNLLQPYYDSVSRIMQAINSRLVTYKTSVVEAGNYNLRYILIEMALFAKSKENFCKWKEKKIEQ